MLSRAGTRENGRVTSRRRPLLQLAGAVATVVVVAVAFMSRGDATPSAARPAAAQDTPGAVLLVPGYGGSVASFGGLTARLESTGRRVIVVHLPGSGTGDLREAAKVLQRDAEQALAAGAPSVDVVGYSAGGVTARYWAKELGGDRIARRIVTLGSPHHGTMLATVGAAFGPVCTLGCRQLAPGSELLQALNSGDETPDGPRWLSMWSTNDEVVTPPETARLDGAANIVLQSICPQVLVHHGEFPATPLVVGLVLRAVGSGDVPRPSRDDCADLTFAGG
jgi:triacylglycerol esterase/lipase EstA (alpha/beta hydrolase family)